MYFASQITRYLDTSINYNGHAKIKIISLVFKNLIKKKKASSSLPDGGRDIHLSAPPPFRFGCSLREPLWRPDPNHFR